MSRKRTFENQHPSTADFVRPYAAILMKEGFEDSSWCNDATASFTLNTGMHNLKVYIEDINHPRHECENAFAVSVEYDQSGAEVFLSQTDDFLATMALIGTLHQAARTAKIPARDEPLTDREATLAQCVGDLLSVILGFMLPSHPRLLLEITAIKEALDLDLSLHDQYTQVINKAVKTLLFAEAEVPQLKVEP